MVNSDVRTAGLTGLVAVAALSCGAGVWAQAPVTLVPDDIIVVDRDTYGVPQTPNRLRGAVFLVDPDGTQNILAKDGPFIGPQDGVFTSDGVFYVCDRTFPDGRESGGGAVFRVNLYTGEKALVSELGLFSNPRTILWDEGSERLLVMDAYSNPENFANARGAIIGVDRETGEQTVVCAKDKFREPVGLIRESTKKFIIVDERAGSISGPGGTDTGTIFRWNAYSNHLTTITTGGYLTRPRDGAIGPDGHLYIADYAADPDFPNSVPDSRFGSVIRVNLETGRQDLVASGGLLLRPYSLCFDKDGAILVVDKGENDSENRRGLLIRIDPITREQTILSGFGDFVQPVSVQLVPQGYPDLVLTAPVMVRGQEVTLTLDGVTPQEIGYFFYGRRGTGSTPIARLNIVLDLAQPALLGTDLANNAGHTELTITIPTDATVGQKVVFQGVARRSSSDSVKSAITTGRIH